MIAESIIAVILISIIKKYDLRNIEDFPKKYLPFVLVFCLIQFSLILAAKLGVNLDNIRFLHFVSFLFFYPYFIKNYHYTGMLVLVVGVTLNLLAMAFNGYMMPIEGSYYSKMVSKADFQATKLGYNLYHQLVDENTRLYWLGDIIPLFKPYPFPKVLSIGDLMISGGFVALVVSTLKGDYKKLRGKNEN